MKNASANKSFLISGTRAAAFVLAASAGLTACGSSEQYQALQAEFNRTIPTCSSSTECDSKWRAARQWVVANADFQLRSDTQDRIDTLNSDATRSGTAIQVDRVALGNGNYQIVVDVECFAAYGCPNDMEKQIEFNQVVSAAGN